MRARRRGAGQGTQASPARRAAASDLGTRMPAARRRSRTAPGGPGAQRRAPRPQRAASPGDRGAWLAHAIRLLLEYTDSSYEEKKYTMGDAPDFDRSQWLSEKFKLGLDFPNLPYLIDGAHRLTQSNAILRYIARKHNLCGETEEERIRVDILENEIMDIRMYHIRTCYSPDYEKVKPEFLKVLPEKMKLFSQFLGKRSWFAGDKLTYVDFLAYDLLDIMRMFEPKCLDVFSNLKDFLVRFEGLKKISAYMKSSRSLPTPVYSKMAMWGNK